MGREQVGGGSEAEGDKQHSVEREGGGGEGGARTHRATTVPRATETEFPYSVSAHVYETHMDYFGR